MRSFCWSPKMKSSDCSEFVCLHQKVERFASDTIMSATGSQGWAKGERCHLETALTEGRDGFSSTIKVLNVNCGLDHKCVDVSCFSACAEPNHTSLLKRDRTSCLDIFRILSGISVRLVTSEGCVGSN